MELLNTVLKEVSKEGRVKFPIMNRKEFLETPIEILELDARSNNALKKTNINTIKDLLNNLNELPRIRGCGTKSISRIMHRICTYYYGSLREQERMSYLKKIIQLNKRGE